MSTYLEKLRARKRQKGQPGEGQKQQKAKAVPVGRGAITAKTPSCTFCSTPKRPFSENAAIPSFCRVDCLNFQLSTVADLPPVLLCWQTEDNELWRPFRLDKMRRCPLITKVAPPPTTGPEIPGLPCGGCGSTRYRRVVNGFAYPDGSRADGWHCGGRDCHIKLLTGNKDVEHINRPPKRARP